MVVKLDKPIQEEEDNVTHVSLMPTVIENLVKLNMSMFYFSSIFELLLFPWNKLVLFLCLANCGYLTL